MTPSEAVMRDRARPDEPLFIRGIARPRARLQEPLRQTWHDAPVRAVVQRVTEANVTVRDDDGAFTTVAGAIAHGLCVLVGVTHDDDETTAAKLADKIWTLRVFDDDDGVMNRAAADVGGEILVVSQFTLYGDTSGGRRPSWVDGCPTRARRAARARRRRPPARARRHRRDRALPHRDAGVDS